MEGIRAVAEMVEKHQQDDISRYIVQIEGLWVASIKHNKESFMNRFEIGLLVNQLLTNKEKGDNMIEAISATLSAKLGYAIRPNRLYEMARIVRVFKNDQKKFEEFLNQVLHFGISWNFIVKNCTPKNMVDFVSDKDKEYYVEDVKNSAETVVKAAEDANERVNNITNSEHFEESHKNTIKETVEAINHGADQIIYSSLKKPLTDISKRLKSIIEILQSGNPLFNRNKEAGELLKVINQLEEALAILKSSVQSKTIEESQEVS